MSNKNLILFQFLRVIAWIIFVGLCIEAGGLIVNFIFSIYNPDFIPNLYNKLDTRDLMDHNPTVGYQIYTLMLTISILKAFMFYLVVVMMHKISLKNPFDEFLPKQIRKISTCTFTIGILNIIGEQFTKHLMHKSISVGSVNSYWENGDWFIIMSAVIYIIAFFFKQAVDLKNENDLTI